jgi:hypothetical protein
MKLECGELVLYYGRLAEMVGFSTKTNMPMVELTDEGGLVHHFAILHSGRVQRLTRPGECVLDAIRRAAATELTPAQQLRRMAELWLAAPQVGDTFLVESGYLIELTEIWDSGEIIALKKPYAKYCPVKAVRPISFDSALALRRFLELATSPVYRAAAHSSNRPDFQDHELLKNNRK